MMYATVEEVRARLQSGEDIDYLDDQQFEQVMSPARQHTPHE